MYCEVFCVLMQVQSINIDGCAVLDRSNYWLYIGPESLMSSFVDFVDVSSVCNMSSSCSPDSDRGIVLGISYSWWLRGDGDLGGDCDDSCCLSYALSNAISVECSVKGSRSRSGTELLWPWLLPLRMVPL